MPDFKIWDRKSAGRYCKAPDYRDAAISAIKEMHRQVGDLVLDDDGIAVRGLLIRHLVMPNNTAGSDKILKFIADEISPETYVNVMDQYRPCGEAHEDEYIDRRLSSEEFRAAISVAEKAGLKRLDPRDRVRFVFTL
jgi:putative pyruvate formate lyase activating enzyme